MPANTLWNIAFGAYAFTVDRKKLTYRLEETETGTVWAEGLSLGTLEIIERETGITTTYSFGDLKLLSLSEKAGVTGKRILFGLDAPGRVPVDVYLTCTEREIQLTLEANRDTKTHRVGAITLLPGLCGVSEDSGSHLVVPHREGAMVRAQDAPEETTPLRIWDADQGLTMPFVGAVRKEDHSALALLTDSAYGIADLARSADSARLDLRYERDPERRRLDVRVVLIPHGDAIAIARAYRDKNIGDGGHVTIRKKMREKPALSAWREGANTVAIPQKQIALPLETNRWRAMEEWMEEARESEATDTGYLVELSGDWAAPFVDLWQYVGPPRFGVAVPLLSVVHHDATPLCFETNPTEDKPFLRALLYLAPPVSSGLPSKHTRVLHALYELSIGAFLTEHRFLTPDFTVEEVRYSNGVCICINQSEEGDYETEELHLPPLGFLVSHPNLLAFRARRVGAELFDAAMCQMRKI